MAQTLALGGISTHAAQSAAGEFPSRKITLPTAHTGMNRSSASAGGRPRSFPRACGDGPISPELPKRGSKFSPRVRGWAERPGRPALPAGVFPRGHNPPPRAARKREGPGGASGTTAFVTGL